MGSRLVSLLDYLDKGTRDSVMYGESLDASGSFNSKIRLLAGKFIDDTNYYGLKYKVYKNVFVIPVGKWLQGEWNKFGWPRKHPGFSINGMVLQSASNSRKLIVLVDIKTKEIFVGDPYRLLIVTTKWKVRKGKLQLQACPKYCFYRYKGEPLNEVREKCRQIIPDWIHPLFQKKCLKNSI
jgi:hypothetical protein